MLSHGLRWARISVAAILSAFVAMGAQASQTVVVGPQTTLDGLARKFGVPKRVIAEANGIGAESILVDGRTLVIPDPPAAVKLPVTMSARGTVIGNRVGLRKGPGTGFLRVTLLDHGSALSVTAEKGDWLQVTGAGIPHAWVRKDFVQVTSGAAKLAPAPKGGPVGRVTVAARAPGAIAAAPGRPSGAVEASGLRCIRGDRIALRQKPDRSSPRAALMDDGALLRLLAKGNGWCKVRLLEGPTGWVLACYVSDRSRVGRTAAQIMAAREADARRARVASSRSHRVRTASAGRRSGRFVRHSRPEADAPRAGTDVVRTAYAYRGTRYRYGGSARGGFDCSGFTRYVYGRKGVALPHNAAAQFSQGKRVSGGNLKAGDLVFFHTTRRAIGHVGIYVGSGKFVHASSAGGRVRVDTLKSGYYKDRYRGARRVK
jgi:cell wall-associated NlpC family hydrolase/LysM repeat protein